MVNQAFPIGRTAFALSRVFCAGVLAMLAGCGKLPIPVAGAGASSGAVAVERQATGPAPSRSGRGSWNVFAVNGYPQGIVRAKDGGFWVADGDMSPNLSRFSLRGKQTVFPIGYEPLEMVRDGGGNLWLNVARFEEQILRVTPQLQVTPFTLTDDAFGGIALGGDGNIWFVESTHIGRLTPAGNLTEYPVPRTQGESGLTWGIGNLVWFRTQTALASLDPNTGDVKTYGAPMIDCGGALVSAPDGSLWYLIQSTGHVTLVHYKPETQKAITYAAPVRFLPYGSPAGLAFDADGSLWYTAQHLNQTFPYRVTGGGFVRFNVRTKTFTTYVAPQGYAWSWDIAFGPNGQIWGTAGAQVEVLTPH